MIKQVILSIVLIFSATLVQAQINVYDSIKHASLERTYQLHVPSAYNSANPTPLVIGLHGGGSLSWLNFEQSCHLISKSNSNGFILVYPEGVLALGMRTWNGGGCCGYSVLARIDDVGFIRDLIDTLRAKYNIDTTRIYATGLSNGAIMSYRLASELSNRIAAIAPVSGTLEDSAFTFNPQRSVPIIQFHSVLDSNIYLQGGYGIGSSKHKFNSVNYGLQKFATYNNCAANPDSTHFTVGAEYYYKKHWHSCSCGAEEILYVTSDGGHSWPGGSAGASEGADPPSTIINANDSIWNFFQHHTLNCNTSSAIGTRYAKASLVISPNPFSSKTTMQLSEPLENATLNVYNTYGQQVKQLRNISAPTVVLHRDNLPCGLYFLQLMQDNKVLVTSKLVIADQ